MSTAPPSSWEAKHHSDNPGSCEFARETIEVRESLCFFGYGGPRGRQTIQRIPKEGLCFCRVRWRSRKAIAQKWKLALLFNNAKQLTVSEHLWKMRPKKCARDCRTQRMLAVLVWCSYAGLKLGVTKSIGAAARRKVLVMRRRLHDSRLQLEVAKCIVLAARRDMAAWRHSWEREAAQSRSGLEKK